jgi:hypothetical protein
MPYQAELATPNRRCLVGKGNKLAATRFRVVHATSRNLAATRDFSAGASAAIKLTDRKRSTMTFSGLPM